MTSHKIIIKGLLAILLLAGIFGAGILMRKDPVTPTENTPLSQATQDLYANIHEVTAMIDKQTETEQALLSEFQSGTYTQENPLVVVNPYEISPLTAIVMFKTNEPVQVKLHIAGRDADADVGYFFSDYRSEHILPIYGLYPGSSNLITLTLYNENSETQVKTLNISTDQLSPDLARNKLSIYKSQYPISPGFTFSYRNGFSSSAKTAFDLNGDYRWYLTKNYHTSASFDSGKRIVLSLGNPYGDILVVEMNYLGKITKAYYSPYGNHHDIAVTETELIITGSDNMPNTIEDFLYSIDRNTGNINHSLNYLNVLDRTRNYGYFYNNKDWMHMNSVVEYEGDLIVSSNHQNSVIRNDWDGNIKWILGDPALYTTLYQAYLLKPVGKNFIYPYNQHAVEVLPDTDGNPDTVDILLFDNGYSRFIVNEALQFDIRANKTIEPFLFSRMVQYQINEREMTVRQIWQYGQDRPELFAQTRGDANLLKNGNYLGSFFSDVTKNGTRTQRNVYVEIDKQQRVVWECVATSSNAQNSYIEYRAERFEIYNPETALLNLGQNAQNLIPTDLLTKAKESVAAKEDNK